MTGTSRAPQTPQPESTSFRIWLKNRQQVEQEIVEGRPFRVLESERGRYDGMLDFMTQSGLWAAATGMRPSGLKKDNGVPYPCLNGLLCLKELSGLATAAECGPLLRDAYLLERVGFTAEQIQRRIKEDRTIVDPETLLNHLGRFTAADLEAGFQRHVEVIRSKRWLRGGVYAVDGHDIMIPYGKDYEGATHIAQGSYGYKLLVLLNVQEDCELIVGYVLGGLEESEITMLRRLLKQLDQSMGPLRNWLKILLMDRGYWGTDLFCELHEDYGIDFVTRVRDPKLAINQPIERQLSEPGRSWSRFQEERQFSGRKETQWVDTTALQPITLISDDPPYRQITVPVVVARQSHLDGSPLRDEKGNDISTTYYVTSLRPGLNGGKKIRGFYRRRWSVENQGFRVLSQTWEIDRPASHSYGAVLGRLVFVFMIYNACHLYEHQSRHRPDYAEELQQRRRYGPGLGLAGATNIVLTESGHCCGISTRDLLRLQKQRIQRALHRELEAGRSLEDVLKNFGAG
jgi:hypothetical protein